VALAIRPAALPVLAVFWASLLGCWLLARRGSGSANVLKAAGSFDAEGGRAGVGADAAVLAVGLLHPFGASVDAFPLATGINRRGQVCSTARS
jgi:hypothetical protein